MALFPVTQVESVCTPVKEWIPCRANIRLISIKTYPNYNIIAFQVSLKTWNRAFTGALCYPSRAYRYRVLDSTGRGLSAGITHLNTGFQGSFTVKARGILVVKTPRHGTFRITVKFDHRSLCSNDQVYKLPARKTYFITL